METKNYYLTPENWGVQGIVDDEQLAALVADLRTIQDFEDVRGSEAVELSALTDGRFALIYDGVIEVYEGDCGGADCVYQVTLGTAVPKIDSLAALEAVVDADDCARILYRKMEE